MIVSAYIIMVLMESCH